MAADLVIKNGWVVTPEATFKGGVAISNDVIVAIGADDSLPQGKEEIDVKGKHILPGLFDGHVHFREPGMTHKEDFATGSKPNRSSDSEKLKPLLPSCNPASSAPPLFA